MLLSNKKFEVQISPTQKIYWCLDIIIYKKQLLWSRYHRIQRELKLKP